MYGTSRGSSNIISIDMLKPNAQKFYFQKHMVILSMRGVAVCHGMISMLWDQMGQQMLTTVRCGATRTVTVEALLLIWERGVTSRVKTVGIISGIKPMLFFI